MWLNYKDIVFIVLLLGFFVKSEEVNAQIKGYDVVHLKNGSILKGAILSTDEDSTIKIMIKGGSVFAYPYSLVQKMSFNVGTSSNPNQNKIRFQINFGLLMGQGGGIVNYLGPVLPDFDINIGYKKNKHFMSISSGIEFFDNSFVPLLGNYQYQLSEKSVTPFIDVYGGINFGIGSNGFTTAQNGPAFGGGIGLKRTFFNGVEFLLNAGYRFQQYKYSYSDWFFGTTTTTIQANRIQLKMGIGF